MSFTIGRLQTRVHSRTPIARERLAVWEEQISSQDGAALAARWVHEDEWLLIRRLPVAVHWRADAVDADVGLHWSQALARAIDEALTRDDGNCVRYRDERSALADLLYRSALRDTRRQWAWHRAGLIPQAEMSCEEVLRAGAARLLRSPELVWPVLMRLVWGERASASLTGALRGIPPVLWLQLLLATPRSAPYARVSGSVQEISPSAHLEDLDEAELLSEAPRTLLAWTAARPYFAQRHREILAVLIAAQTWPPEGVAPGVVRRRLASIHARIARVLPPAPLREASAPATDRAAAAAPARSEPDRTPHLATPARELDLPQSPPELPELDVWEPTHFGGVLFWLGRFGTRAAPDALRAAADAPADALRLMLRETALALGAPAEDAALRAFCGGQVPEGEAPAAIVECAAALVQEWSRWLDEASPELPAPRMASVCRRSGRLRSEPGWIELHLPLAQVDISIRRLGLDLDPGWLPWHGCALRICYVDA